MPNPNQRFLAPLADLQLQIPKMEAKLRIPQSAGMVELRLETDGQFTAGLRQMASLQDNI